jgi:hypothetical protein
MLVAQGTTSYPGNHSARIGVLVGMPDHDAVKRIASVVAVPSQSGVGPSRRFALPRHDQVRVLAVRGGLADELEELVVPRLHT